MTRKLIITFVFVLLMVSASFSAFAGENVHLQVNGDVMPSPGMYLVEGVTMIPLDTYVRLAGADVQWSSDNNFSLTENGSILNLSLGKKEAMLGEKPILLTVEPSKTGDNVYIPLRAVSNAFGFEVDWNGEQWLVTLTRTENRDGMTVLDLLTKSTVAGQTYNTYSMEGLFNIAIDLTADGKPIEQAPKNVISKLTGQIQNKPLQVYMKQSIAPEAGDKIPEMVVETYMNQEKMYIKAPGQDWIVQSLPFSPEFWKQQQDIQSDPLKAAAQMKEMGILLNFGNDVKAYGKDYYVVNAALDMNKFKQVFQNFFQQGVQGIPQGTDSGNTNDMQQQMQKVFENAKLDYNYSALINKETMISDIIKFNARMEMDMENPAPPVNTDGEQKVNAPTGLKMVLEMKGDITITNLGGSFNSPDISSAKE